MRYLLVILAFLFSTTRTLAVFSANENCKSAYRDMLCLQFDAAKLKLNTEKKVNPTNQLPYLYENYIDFLKVTLGEEEKDFATLKNSFEIRLQKLATADAESPWTLYSQACMYMHMGFARMKFNEYFSAALDINRTYRLFEENNRKYPNFAPNKAGLGLLHALIGSAPAKYRWATKTLNFKGSIPQGQAELNAAYKLLKADPQLNFMAPETATLLSFVTVNLSADMPAALRIADELENGANPKMGESALLTYIVANIHSKNGDNEKVISLLGNRQQAIGSYPFHYLNYIYGVALMGRLDNNAQYPLLSFVADFKGKNYVRSAYMYLSWYYLIHNNPAQYNVYVSRIKQRGNNQVDNDKEATKMADERVQPDIALLKARLLFDGGYYERAVKELAGYKSLNPKCELEYQYRLGRIYDKWNKPSQAIPYYEKAITLGEKLAYYFAANASLNLALIYERAKDYAKAKYYFQKVLNMDFEEYRFGINNKAQAGLSRLSKK